MDVRVSRCSSSRYGPLVAVRCSRSRRVANTTGALSRLKETGLTPSEIAVRLWISLASVYRILAE